MLVCVAPVVAAAQDATQERVQFLAPEYFQALKDADQAADTALRDTLSDAIAKFQDQQYQESLELLDSAAARYPGLPSGRVMLARVFLATKRIQQAKSMLEQAAAFHSDYPGTYLLLGNLAMLEGRLTDALLEYEAGGERASSDAVPENQRRLFQLQSHAGIATVAEARNDWQVARRELAAWLDLDPTNGQARQRLGRALFGLDQIDDAYAQLVQAQKDDPNVEPATVSMGWLHYRKGNEDEAADWMKRAETEEPNNPRVHVAVGSWLLEQNRVDEATGHAETLEQLAPQSPDLKMLRGSIAQAQNDYAEAERQFDSLLKQTPGNLAASNRLALALIEQSEQEKRQRALELAQANARQQPNSTEALSTLGWVLYKMGRLDEAERVLQASVAGGRASANTAYYLAHVLSDRGRLPQVRKLLHAALATKGPFAYREEAEKWLGEIGPGTP
jgi:tetratricopeptide (TPR) repeat protein